MRSTPLFADYESRGPLPAALPTDAVILRYRQEAPRGLWATLQRWLGGWLGPGGGGAARWSTLRIEWFEPGSLTLKKARFSAEGLEQKSVQASLASRRTLIQYWASAREGALIAARDREDGEQIVLVQAPPEHLPRYLSALLQTGLFQDGGVVEGEHFHDSLAAPVGRCRECGGPLPSFHLSRLCPGCRPAHQHKYCGRCGGPLPCADCQDTPARPSS